MSAVPVASSAASLRELGNSLFSERHYLRALGIFAEGVRRVPADHRARMMAARCFAELGERERAVLVLHACAEGLLRRDFLLSAIAACRQALDINPQERMVRDTLQRVHARAVKTAPGRPAVPPALPPDLFGDEPVHEDLLTLQGSALADRAMEVLIQADPSRPADANARPPLPLFADLDLEAFLDLVRALDYRTVPARTVLSEAGEGGDVLTVIVAGKAEVSRVRGGHERTLGFLGGGSIFGDVALLTGTLPTAKVTAAVPTEIFEIRREALHALVQVHPEVPAKLAEFAQQRMGRTLTGSSPMFLALDEKDRVRLLQSFEYRSFVPGEVLVREGEPSPGLLILLAGEMEVRKSEPGHEDRLVGHLVEGDVAGEISLLTGAPASATVQATRRCAIAFLPRRAFPAQAEAFPRMLEFLETLSTRRLKELHQGASPSEILDADELVLEPTAEPATAPAPPA